MTSIHDLSFEHLPETFKWHSQKQMKITIRRTARDAAHIVTCSEYSRQDIIDTYQIAPDKITTIPLAAADWFRPVTDETELNRVRLKYDLPDDFLLGVGSVQPRKNLVRLSRRTRSFGQTRSAAADTRRKKGVALRRFAKGRRRTWCRGQGAFTDFVPDEDLPGLYTLSTCFVYPSFFEGFGIPPLEAMQCGSPVITGDRTSLPEVVGDAGILVDPFDVTSIADAIERMLSDSGLRDEFRQKGFERAKRFSWQRAARETLDVFEKVMND